MTTLVTTALIAGSSIGTQGCRQLPNNCQIGPLATLMPPALYHNIPVSGTLYLSYVTQRHKAEETLVYLQPRTPL